MARAVIIVMDSCGVGSAADAAEYGNAGADTLGNTARAVAGLELPHFEAAGLGNLHGDLIGVPPVASPNMAFGRMAERSSAKDSTTGHWEIAGLVTPEPFATFPGGFPLELVDAISTEGGHRFIGNQPASGTAIIEELGAEHLETGAVILYTSADSVFQLAAHKEVVPLQDLYRICEIARRHCDPYRIGRVIARPFEGDLGSFRRTYERHDYAMPPDGETVLDLLAESGHQVHAIGKIEDLFAGRGIQDSVHTEGDADGLHKTLEAMNEVGEGLIFTNLVDLDMVYGHRENPAGYAEGLRLIDGYLRRVVESVQDDDLLFITADHGNDPTDGSTDHTREQVPLLVSAPRAAGTDLGLRRQFADVGATIAEHFGLPSIRSGESFLEAVT